MGSRRYKPIEKVQDYLKNLDIKHSHIVTGDAEGVDSEAAFWARHRGIPYTIYPAIWHPNGPDAPMDRGAGLRRNREIVHEADDMVVFWDGRSHGSADDIRLWFAKTGHQPHIYGPVGLPIEVSHEEVLAVIYPHAYGKESLR